MTAEQFLARPVQLCPAPYPHLLEPCRLYPSSAVGKYGAVRFEGRAVYAHRLAYTLLVGPIPAGKHVLHHCDRQPCIEGTHLYVGTPQDNAQDCVVRGRKNAPTGNRHRSRTCPESYDKQRGELHSKAKLTDAMVLTLRQRHADGESFSSLGRELGLHSTTVSDAVSGRKWAHI